MNIGILALQGDFDLHRERLTELGAKVLLIRRAQQLEAIDGLVIPGGESTTMLRLVTEELWTRLEERISGGLPTLATCAGLILLAKNVSNPAQRSLALLDVDVTRNAYGRQIDSFVDPQLNWTSAGRNLLEQTFPGQGEDLGSRTMEGVFIRAPKIIRVGKGLEVLMERGMEPVLVRQGKILGAAFHPELGFNTHAVHRLLMGA